MSATPMEDGLRVVDADDDGRDREALAAADGHHHEDHPSDGDLEALRDEFVEAFNARDLDAVMALVTADVEVPDIRSGDGAQALSEELEAIWERSPGAILTRAFLEGCPCAIGWLPDEDGCWIRAALVCFDAEGGALTLVALPDDADSLDRAEAEEPSGEELDEWSDWSEWDRGEETIARERR